MIFDIVEELEWYEIEFTFKMYYGETFEDTEDKVVHSLGNFPYLVHSFDIIEKGRTGDWGQLITLSVHMGIYPDVTLAEVFEKFDKVTHLQNRNIIN